MSFMSNKLQSWVEFLHIEVSSCSEKDKSLTLVHINISKQMHKQCQRDRFCWLGSTCEPCIAIKVSLTLNVKQQESSCAPPSPARGLEVQSNQRTPTINTFLQKTEAIQNGHI